MREQVDKQKLLQWVEDQIYVYSGPYTDTDEEAAVWKGNVRLLRVLEMNINAGRLDVTKEG